MKRYSSLILSPHCPSKAGKGIPHTLGAPGRTDPLKKRLSTEDFSLRGKSQYDTFPAESNQYMDLLLKARLKLIGEKKEQKRKQFYATIYHSGAIWAHENGLMGFIMQRPGFIL